MRPTVLIPHPPASQTLDELVRQGAISDATRSAVRQAASAVDTKQSPWFLRLLIGAGAWIAGALFLLFLLVAHIVDSRESAIIVGLVFVGVTTTVRRLVAHEFWVQLAMAGCVAGQILSIGGVTALAESVYAGAAFALLLEAVLFVFYRDVVMHFLTAAGAAGALLALGLETDALILADAVAIISIFGGAWLWLAPTRLEPTLFAERRVPGAYGLTLFGLGLLAAHLLAEVDAFRDPWMLAWPTTLGLSILLVFLTLHITRTFGLRGAPEPMWVAIVATGLLFAVTHDCPGIIASLTVFALAVTRRSLVLLGIACVFLVGFVSFFYYSLEATLLAKSGMLLGAGLVLLALRFYLRARSTVSEAKTS